MLLKLGGALSGALIASLISVLATVFGSFVIHPKVIVWPVIRKRWGLLLLVLVVDLFISGAVLGGIIGAALSCSCFAPGGFWAVPIEAVPYILGGALGVIGLGFMPDNRITKSLRDKVRSKDLGTYGAGGSSLDVRESPIDEGFREVVVKRVADSFSTELAKRIVAVERQHRTWRRVALADVREYAKSRFRSLTAGWRQQIEQTWYDSCRSDSRLMFGLIAKCSMQNGDDWAVPRRKAEEAMSRLSVGAKALSMSPAAYAESVMCLNLIEQADCVFEAALNAEQFAFLADHLSLKLVVRM